MREYKLIAHRGSHKFAKENSLFSFFNAINENYYGFECDVRQSKDKKFYIYHDMLYHEFDIINESEYGKLYKEEWKRISILTPLTLYEKISSGCEGRT